MSSPLRPDPLGPGGTRSEQETAEGEVHTSHCMFLNSFVVDEPEFVHMAMPIDMEEFCNQSSASGDEVGLALIDTACTACMHSMSWRLAFSRRLPDMVKCEPLQQFKTFILPTALQPHPRFKFGRFQYAWVVGQERCTQQKCQKATLPPFVHFSSRCFGCSRFHAEETHAPTGARRNTPFG